MHLKSIAELSKHLHAKQISSVELTQHFLSRIKQYEPRINSLITLTAELALEQAQQADVNLANTNAGALTGIPFIHKDNFCTLGVKTSAGSKMLDNFIAPYNATVTQKLYNAGMPMLGKANMDEFAMGSSNENSYYGPVNNPWNLHTVPGGSSGGSAAAVAAGFAPMATATDTGGSIRQPAAFCGLTGLKPTYGRVSRWGIIAYASSLDQAGIMAHRAEDVAWLMNVIAGFDAHDATSISTPVPDYTASLNASLHGIRVGIPKEYFAEGLDPEIATCILDAAKELQKLGATLHDISLPSTHLAIPAYYVIAPAECASNLARFDGVRYGYRCEAPKDLNDLYQRSRGEGFGTETKRRILIGTYMLSAGYYQAYYVKAQKIRQLICNEFNTTFKTVDVILSPTAPTVAFPHQTKSNDPISMYLSDVYTVATNMTGLPGISLPAGFVNKLPIGLQLVGNHCAEAKILNIAHRYQQVTDWHNYRAEGFT